MRMHLQPIHVGSPEHRIDKKHYSPMFGNTDTR